MALWNETTARILKAVTKAPHTVGDLANELDCSRSNVATPLLKLLRAGHVQRTLGDTEEVILKEASKSEKAVSRPGRVYVYRITPRGQERLKRIKIGGRNG